MTKPAPGEPPFSGAANFPMLYAALVFGRAAALMAMLAGRLSREVYRQMQDIKPLSWFNLFILTAVIGWVVFTVLWWSFLVLGTQAARARFAVRETHLRRK